ncbi:hypothetical protein BY996DRAFT_6414547 [Phakopsora pachyrhizi]|nr:hypothetical protein BY996DRAFT_6414547 [Phakopsora pachyrhizi]
MEIISKYFPSLPSESPLLQRQISIILNLLQKVEKSAVFLTNANIRITLKSGPEKPMHLTPKSSTLLLVLFLFHQIYIIASNSLEAGEIFKDALEASKSLEEESPLISKIKTNEFSDKEIKYDGSELKKTFSRSRSGGPKHLNEEWEDEVKSPVGKVKEENREKLDFFTRLYERYKKISKKLYRFFFGNLLPKRPKTPPLFDFTNEKDLYKGPWNRDLPVSFSSRRRMLNNDEELGRYEWIQWLRNSNANELQEKILSKEVFLNLAKTYFEQNELAFTYQKNIPIIHKRLKELVEDETWIKSIKPDERVKELLKEIEKYYKDHSKGPVALHFDSYYYKMQLSPLLLYTSKYNKDIAESMSKNGILHGANKKKQWKLEILQEAAEEYTKYLNHFKAMRETESAFQDYVQKLGKVPIDNDMIDKEAILEQFELPNIGKDIDLLRPSKPGEVPVKDMGNFLKELLEVNDGSKV